MTVYNLKKITKKLIDKTKNVTAAEYDDDDYDSDDDSSALNPDFLTDRNIEEISVESLLLELEREVFIGMERGNEVSVEREQTSRNGNGNDSINVTNVMDDTPNLRSQATGQTPDSTSTVENDVSELIMNNIFEELPFAGATIEELVNAMRKKFLLPMDRSPDGGLTYENVDPFVSQISSFYDEEFHENQMHCSDPEPLTTQSLNALSCRRQATAVLSSFKLDDLFKEQPPHDEDIMELAREMESQLDLQSFLENSELNTVGTGYIRALCT